MKKSITGLALAASLAAVPLVAHGSDRSGVYVAVQGGIINYDSGNLDGYYTNLGAGATFTRTNGTGSIWGTGPTTGRVLKGTLGYQVNSRWGMEASAFYLGPTKYSGVNATGGTVNASSRAGGTSATLVAVAAGGEPGDYLSLLARLGVAYVHATSDITTGGTLAGGMMTPFGGGSSVDITYGLGLLYDFNDSVGLRLDWDNYRTPGVSPSPIQLWTLGFSLKL